MTNYNHELFDLAELVNGHVINHGMYIGICYYSEEEKFDNPNNFTWYFVSDKAKIDKEWRSDEVEIFYGLLKCDEFGNILPKSKQYVYKNSTGKSIIGSGLRIEKTDKILMVKANQDYKRDKNGNIKYKGKYQDVTYVYTEPKGNPGSLARRLEARKIRQEKEAKIQRWKNRGTLYSPWNDFWKVKDTHPDFYKAVTTFRNDNFTGHRVGTINTTEELFELAKTSGVDIDELEQYMSEAGCALAEARAYNSMYGN